MFPMEFKYTISSLSFHPWFESRPVNTITGRQIAILNPLKIDNLWLSYQSRFVQNIKFQICFFSKCLTYSMQFVSNTWVNLACVIVKWWVPIIDQWGWALYICETTDGIAFLTVGDITHNKTGHRHQPWACIMLRSDTVCRKPRILWQHKFERKAAAALTNRLTTASVRSNDTGPWAYFHW